MDTTDPLDDDTVPVPDDLPLGSIRISDDGRLIERKVFILTGEGHWAYWASNTFAERFSVLVDVLCNPRASNFAGYLPHFWSERGKAADLILPPERSLWIVTKGFVDPGPERRIYVEDEDEGLPRLERR